MGVIDLSINGIAPTVDALESVASFWSAEAEAAYVVAPTVSYAIYQEQGTSDIPARPYMKPAAEKVATNIQTMQERYGSQASEASPIEALAIAVQNEAKKIADRKDVRDTGALINSITYEQVQ